MREAQPREKKYRFGSELRESITIAEIGKKVMNMPVSLIFGEILVVSPDLAAHFSEQAPDRPIENTTNTTNTANTANTTNTHCPQRKSTQSSHVPFMPVLLIAQKSFSPRKAFDLEINLMPHRTFEKLNISIDSDVTG